MISAVIDVNTSRKLTELGIFILILELKVLLDSLLPMKMCRKPCIRCQPIGYCKASLACLKVFNAEGRDVLRMEVKLTTTVMSMAMKRRNHKFE
jgi:hypothetical protein